MPSELVPPQDIVTESCAFDVVNFIPLLRERIYTKNPFARQFIVSWVCTQNTVPSLRDLLLTQKLYCRTQTLQCGQFVLLPDHDVGRGAGHRHARLPARDPRRPLPHPRRPQHGDQKDVRRSNRPLPNPLISLKHKAFCVGHAHFSESQHSPCIAGARLRLGNSSEESTRRRPR